MPRATARRCRRAACPSPAEARRMSDLSAPRLRGAAQRPMRLAMSTRRIGTAMSRRRIGLGLRLLGLTIVGALSFGALAGARSGPCGGAGYGGYGGYNSHARCDVTPPRATLKTPKLGRKAALRRGVAASLTCSEPCTARLALTLNRAGAGKLKLGRKPVVAGRAPPGFPRRPAGPIRPSQPP